MWGLFVIIYLLGTRDLGYSRVQAPGESYFLCLKWSKGLTCFLYVFFFLTKSACLFFFPGNEDEKAKQAGPDGERHGLKRQRDEKEEHGRAYFEFREEAYNSRWATGGLGWEFNPLGQRSETEVQ